MAQSVRVLSLLGALAGAGCALVAPVPGGPVRANTVTQLQPSWAIAYGRASASVGAARVSGNGQTFGGPWPWGAPIPIRLGVRQALGSVVEASGDWGWVDSGLELRAGSPEGSWPIPVAISAGIRSSILAIPSSDSEGVEIAFNQGTYERRFRVEAYPELSTERFGPMRLLLSAGVSWGAFAHDLVLGPAQSAGPSLSFGPVGVIVVRPETRFEVAIGIYGRGTRGAATVALAPWILLAAGAPTKARCVECAQSGAVSDFSDVGVSLILSPALAGDLIALLMR